MRLIVTQRKSVSGGSIGVGFGLFAVLFTGSAMADPLKLEAGTALALQCETRAVVLATGAANATRGAAGLRLMPAPDTPARGTWTVSSVDEGHTGSLGVAQRALCAAGCPFDVSAKGEAQLWSPKPMPLDQVKETETLLIAVVKPDTLALRATTFRGKEIEALEEGHCKVIP